MLESYVALFSNLRPDKSSARWPSSTTYRAPYKPLLLLAVLDQFAERTLQTNLIEPSPELGELFAFYWSRVMPPDQRGDFALPFFHLRNNGFWHLLPRPGKEGYLKAVRQISTLSDLKETIFGSSVDKELYALLCLQASRDVFRRILIESYFAPEVQSALLDQSVTNREAYQYSEKLLARAKDNLVQNGRLDSERLQNPSRDQGFRRAIIGAYNHCCAFCGLKVLTPEGHTAADAAHIIPWRKTRNDTVNNGMALCKLCHWGFDEGLLEASVQYAVIVSRLVSADYNIPVHLPFLAGRPLTLPVENAFWPDIDALKWHRREVYRDR